MPDFAGASWENPRAHSEGRSAEIVLIGEVVLQLGQIELPRCGFEVRPFVGVGEHVATEFALFHHACDEFLGAAVHGDVEGEADKRLCRRLGNAEEDGSGEQG